MKANSQARTRFKTYAVRELTEPDSHITIFKGLRTGVIITVIFFWIPFVVIYFFFGWLFMVCYGVTIAIVCSVLGLLSRYYSFLRSLVHSKSSAEAFGS